VLTQLLLTFEEYLFTYFSSSYLCAFLSRSLGEPLDKEFLLQILVEIQELVSLSFLFLNKFIIFKILVIILLSLFIIIFVYNSIKNFKDKLVYLHIYPKYILYTCSFFSFSNDDSEVETDIEAEAEAEVEAETETEGITAEAEINNNNLVNEVLTAEESDLPEEENLEEENYKDIDENLG